LRNPALYRLPKSAFTDLLGAIAKGTNAWQHNGGCLREAFRVFKDLYVCTLRDKRVVNAPEVS
jgi:hypothetical protein